MCGYAGGWGALGFWFFLAAIIVAGIWYGIRERGMQHETVRRMIESGQPVDQALQDKLLGGGNQLGRDLKVAGIICMSAAPGLAALGLLVSRASPRWLLPLLGVAALVGCVSVGLLVASKMVEGVNS
jgi:hypothetical protein